MLHEKVLNDLIEREITGADCAYAGEDRTILIDMMDTINSQKGTNIRSLVELDTFHILGAGEIIVNYVDCFSSETVKAYLISHLVLDRVTDCDKIILQLYLRFRKSKEYISPPGKPAPSHIYVRYDNAFRNMKSKRIADALLDVVSSPRDAFYLPLTVGMLASWKLPKLKEILLRYSVPNNILVQDIGIEGNGEPYFPPFAFISKELRFSAINGLKHYPSNEALDALKECALDSDVDIKLAAQRVLKKISPAPNH